jgi:hypothetical protein
MKHEIIYTQDFALIVSDEEITKGDFCYDLDASPGYKNHKSIVRCLRTAKDSYWNKNCKKIIAHRPFTDAAILEGVPLLPEFDESDKVEKLAYNWFVTADKKNTIFDLGWVNIFTAGYNKAKETYKYTEKDLRKAFTKYAFSSTINQPYNEEELEESFNEFIQFLQPKRPQYFECKMEQLSSNESFGLDYGSSSLKPKTIANSQNQTELIGTYYYE